VTYLVAMKTEWHSGLVNVPPSNASTHYVITEFGVITLVWLQSLPHLDEAARKYYGGHGEYI
jgi:hypothetical protein